MMAAAEFTVTDPAAPGRAIDPGLGEFADDLRADAADGTPVLTGRLRAGWRVVKAGDGERVVVNDVYYAPFVEFGTRRTRPAAMMGRALARARTSGAIT